MHQELEPRGLTVVTVALDLLAEKAHPWIDAATPTHPSLIDSSHVTNELLGFINVPMAVWIDEQGQLVRPAELASIEPRPPSDQPLPPDMPERLQRMMGEVKKLPDVADAYRRALLDWVDKGASSRYAMAPDEVIAASAGRSMEHSRAAACFELGHHLHQNGDVDGAVRLWREAHALHHENWTYKRQAWTLETTPDGEPSDLIQGPTERYEGNWLDDVVSLGGGERYYDLPRL